MPLVPEQKASGRIRKLLAVLVFCAPAMLVIPGSVSATSPESGQAASRGEANPDSRGVAALPSDEGAGTDAAIVIGLDADMSKGAAQGGEAIRRGLVMAIEEINAAGGVLGRPLTLVIRDHRGIPARGVDNIVEFSKIENLVAVVGGVHTPVAMAELEAIHEHEILYLGPWAAGTPVVANGYDPNYVFRVSVRDEYAGGFLVRAAREKGYKRLGLLLWKSGWGKSNEAAMNNALSSFGEAPVAIEWFNSGQQDMSREIDALVNAGADVVMLVANPLDGLTAVREIAMRSESERLPIISHWGITGGDFHGRAASFLPRVNLTFLQTYSFFTPPFPKKSERVVAAYCVRFGVCDSLSEITSPVGTAHAYDLMYLLKQAIEKAQSLERPEVRRSMEQLGRFEGLVRVYDPPFSPSDHDALDESDFRLSRYDENGAIVPITGK